MIEIPLLNKKQAARNAELDKRIARTEEKIAAVAKKIPQAARLAELNLKIDDLNAQVARTTVASTKKSLADQANKLVEERKKLLADQQAKNWDKNPPDLRQIMAMRAQIAELQKSKITAPLAVSIAEGGVPGSNREKIGDAPVYLRGEYQRPGPIAPRRFPVVLAGEKQAPLGTRTSQSGRRELAEWIVSADNPLTARVMVNRIWQQMIGRGLVRSPDNFGRLGERPTHPELLDHLSVRFIRSGWSVKSLVRDIALSATFRQATFAAPEATRADPDNLAISHMNRRRLTYEELRDSLLQLSNRLAEDVNAVQRPTTDDACRRTMFEPLDRRKTDVTAGIFDGPDSKAIVPVRTESTTAPQALFLMNNTLAVDTAKRLAERLTHDARDATDSQRLERLWLLSFGRPIESQEAEIARSFIRANSWERFVQALLGTNEFAYLD